MSISDILVDAIETITKDDLNKLAIVMPEKKDLFKYMKKLLKNGKKITSKKNNENKNKELVELFEKSCVNLKPKLKDQLEDLYKVYLNTTAIHNATPDISIETLFTHYSMYSKYVLA